MDKRIELDKKEDWYKNRFRFFNAAYDESVDKQEWSRFCELKDVVIYESPKTYVDGVAYNDGTWVIFNTCRAKNGKVRTNIKCKNVNDLIRTLYGYMVFLRIAGVSNRKMMLYHAVVFFDRLTFVEGMFDCNQKNIGVLQKLIDIVMKKDVGDLTKDWTSGKTGKEKIGCWDDRAFCIDTNGMNKGDITRVQHRVMNKKQELDEQITKYFIEGKSIKEMLDILHANGIKIGKSRYCLWLRERKAVQNGSHSTETIMDSPMTENEDRLSKMVSSAPGGGISNEEGLSKMVHNFFNNKKEIVLFNNKPMDDREERRKNREYYNSEEYLRDFYDKEELDMIMKERERLIEQNHRTEEIPIIREYDIFI